MGKDGDTNRAIRRGSSVDRPCYQVLSWHSVHALIVTVYSRELVTTVCYIDLYEVSRRVSSSAESLALLC
jgi:hypothetical protein